MKVFPPALLGRLVTIPYYPLSDDMLARMCGSGGTAKRATA